MMLTTMKFILKFSSFILASYIIVPVIAHLASHDTYNDEVYSEDRFLYTGVIHQVTPNIQDLSISNEYKG